MIQAVLFDMDGVLIDSEQYICNAAIMMFKEKGYVVQPEDFLPFVGTGENRYIGGVAEKYDIPLDINQAKERTYAIYENITKGKLKALDGVYDFIQKAKEKKLKLAVATSADKIKMDINLQGINLDNGEFDETVNGSEVENKKPAPDIFIIAAKKLGIPPENCLVVEDAVSGVEAAKASGCKCLGLTTSFPASKLSKADWISQTLADAPDIVLEW